MMLRIEAESQNAFRFFARKLTKLFGGLETGFRVHASMLVEITEVGARPALGTIRNRALRDG